MSQRKQFSFPIFLTHLFYKRRKGVELYECTCDKIFDSVLHRAVMVVNSLQIADKYSQW